MPDIAKVKRNVKRMVDGGASEQEIDGYLGTEGVSAEQLRAPALPQPTQAAPVASPQSQSGSWLDPFVGQGILMGAGDEMKAGVRAGARRMFGSTDKSLGDIYSEELGDTRADLEGFRERHSVLSPALEVGGAATGVLATRGGSLVPRAATTVGKLAVGAAEGTGLGALYGFNSGEGGIENRLQNAAISAPFGAAGGAAGGALGAAVGRGARAAPAPSLDDLRGVAHTAFQAVDSSGAVLTPRKVDNVVNSIVSAARKQKINPTLHPDSYAVLQEVIATRGSTPSVSDLHQLRQIVADAATSQKPADRRIAGLMIEALDDQIDGLSVLDVTGGDPKAAVSALRTGMDSWKRFRKGEVIQSIFSNAEIDAGAKYTQAGMETALRNGFKALAKNPKKMRAFTGEERLAIRHVAMGGKTENLLRLLGKFAPRGVVSALPVMGAASYDLGTGAALALGAEGARRGATAMTVRNARTADELVRRGAPARRSQRPLTVAEKSALALSLSSGLPFGSIVDRQFK